MTEPMIIELIDLIVRELVAAYHDDGEGGNTIEDNCQMLCRKCNREKSAK